MKAITQRRYGSPDAFTFAELPTPKVGPTDVLVEVFAADSTQGDRRLRTGDFPGFTFIPARLGLGITGPRNPIPGTAFAGRVAQVGAQVTRFAVGDDVFAEGMGGGYAEFVAVAENSAIAKMPKGWSYEEAASLPYGALTSWEFLSTMAKVQPGQRVCILGGSGGVGRYAIQVAKFKGAHVTGVAGPTGQALMRELGADHVVNYREADFRDANTQTPDAKFDVVLDTVGVSSFGHAKHALATDGHYLSLLVTLKLAFFMVFTRLFGRKKATMGAAMGSAESLDEVRALAESGAFRPVIARVFDLEQIREAHALLDAGTALGSVVVRVRSARPKLVADAA